MQKLDEQGQEQEPPSGSGGATSGESEVGKFYKANRQFRSSTDPDATLVRGGLKSRPRYKHHRVVDDAHEIITAVETTPGAVDEGHRLLDLIQAHEDITGELVATVIADTRYGTTHNLIGCQAQGIRPHLAVLADRQQNAGRRNAIYPESMFIYQPASDTYLCPAGELMRPTRCHPRRLSLEYMTSKGICLSCRFRALCTRSKTGRTIHRHRDQSLLDGAKAEGSSSAAQADLRRRQHLMERSFADAANCHGFKRARWRGLWKQAIQDLLIATVQNLRKLVRHLAQTNPELASRLLRLVRELIALLRSPIRTFSHS